MVLFQGLIPMELNPSLHWLAIGLFEAKTIGVYRSTVLTHRAAR
jgi:hypothetical protein